MEASKKLSVFPICYFGPIHWYAAALAEFPIILEANQHYQKQTYSSRTYIKMANRIMPLVIPVGRRGNRISIKEKRISYEEKWQINHWRSLKTAYQNSPYFEYYADMLQEFYQKKFNFLIDLQLSSLEIINTALKLGLDFSLTTSYLSTDNYGMDYRNAFIKKRNSLPSWFKPIPYTQVFEGFDAGLSILDLLFNEGPSAIFLLRKSFLSKNNSEN